MVKRSVRCLGVLAFVLVTGPAGGADVACTVADPTGTPLNVRDAPNGRVVMTLSNGVRVDRTAERDLEGKGWSLVATEAGTLGWVFSAYLDCVRADRDQQKSAPMRPRPTTN